MCHQISNESTRLAAIERTTETSTMEMYVFVLEIQNDVNFERARKGTENILNYILLVESLIPDRESF